MEEKETNQLIVVKQLPIIEERLQALSIEIDEKVENALALVCTEETRKDVKEVRTLLGKQFKELEEQRKLVKNAVLDPYNKFEEIYKKCVSDKFKFADTELKKKIDEVENNLKEEKKQEVIKYFEEYKTSLNIDFVLFEQANINVDLSTSMKKLKDQSKEFLDKITDDLKLIDMEEHKTEILVEYKKTLNAAASIMEVKNRFKAIEEEKARQEELLKQQEVEAQTIANVNDVIDGQTSIDEFLEAPVSEQVSEQVTGQVSEQVAVGIDTGEGESEQVDIYTMTFKVYGTIEQLKAVKAFLESEGIRYE